MDYGALAQYCVQQNLTYQCSGSNFHTWSGTALGCQFVVVLDDPEGSVPPTGTCLAGSVTKFDNSTAISNLTLTAEPSLDGETVVCTNDGGVKEVDVVIGIETETGHSITGAENGAVPGCVDVLVTRSTGGRLCIESYNFSAAGVGGGEMVAVDPGSSADFMGTLCGLCLLYCDYTYTVEGFHKFGAGDVNDSFAKAAGTCPSVESIRIVEESFKCGDSVSVEAVLSSAIDDADGCLSVTSGGGLSYVVDGTSVTWSNFEVCSGTELYVNLTCCPPLIMPPPIEYPQPQSDVSYFCANDRVSVAVDPGNFYGSSPSVSLQVFDESQNEVEDPNSIPMTYQNYTAEANASCGSCSGSGNKMFVPNAIQDVTTSVMDTSVEVTVTLASCADDTSNFMVELQYQRNGQDSKMPQKKTYSNTVVFVLSDLPRGTDYSFAVELKSGDAVIGMGVSQAFTTSGTQRKGLSTIIIIVAVIFALLGLGLILLAVSITLCLCYYKRNEIKECCHKHCCCCCCKEEGGKEKLEMGQVDDNKNDNNNNKQS